MEICYLPLNMLKEDGRNPFKELKREEFIELMESIKKHGIIIPLIVFQESERLYRVISGRNRLKAARELDLPTVPCIKIDVVDVEGAFETEIYRRHLKPEEKEKYKEKIKVVYEKIINQEVENKLPEELLLSYKTGKLNFDDAIRILKYRLTDLNWDVWKSVGGVDANDDEMEEFEGDEGIELEDEEIKTLNEEEKDILKKAGLEVKDDDELSLDIMKQQSEEINRKMDEVIDEIEETEKKLKKAVSESEKMEYEEKIKNLRKEVDNFNVVNEKLRGMIRKLEAEKEASDEQMKAKEKSVEAEKMDLRARVILWDETERKILSGMIQRRLGVILNEIILLMDEVKRDLPQKEIDIIAGIIKEVKSKLDEFLNYIQKLKSPKYDNFLTMNDLRT